MCTDTERQQEDKKLQERGCMKETGQQEESEGRKEKMEKM